MSRRWTLLYTLALLFFLSLPAAHGAGIDLDQHGLTGAWYDPRTSGQGFMVEVFPDLSSPGTGLALVSWFTYDSVGGGAKRQRWYTMSGPVVSGDPNASLAIYQNSGGNFNAPPITNASPVGTATLSFDSCISGQLSYTFTDGSVRSGTIPLTRLTQNVTCSATSARPTNADFELSGNWFDAATSGQGLTVEVNPISGVIFFAWMTYAPNGAAAGPAGQRWYTGLGAFSAGSSSIPVQLYETTGGLFDDGMASPTTVVVGSGTFTFEGCWADLNFNFTGGSSVGASGTIPLVHMSAYLSGGAGCWDY
jgi:hypothetical protein